MFGGVDDRVVSDIIRFFAPQLPYADDSHLRKLYDLVKAAAPQRSTKAVLRQTHNIVFNGPYGNALPARCGVLSCLGMQRKLPCKRPRCRGPCL